MSDGRPPSSAPTWLTMLMLVAVPSAALAWGHEIKDPKTGEPELLSTTKLDDFIGRWTLRTVSYGTCDTTDHLRFDVVRCGPDLCGIKLSDKDECQQVVLHLKDNGSDKAIINADNPSDRYTGFLDWSDKVAKYYVSADIFGAESDADTSDPATRHLAINGYPASDGIPDGFNSRVFPITADFVYSGNPICHAPSS